MKLTEARELNSKLIVVIMIILSKLAHSSSLSGNILGTRVLRLLIDTYTYSQIDWDRDRNIKLLDWDWVLCSILERDCARFDATIYEICKRQLKRQLWDDVDSTCRDSTLSNYTEHDRSIEYHSFSKIEELVHYMMTESLEQEMIDWTKRSVDWERRINWHRRSLRLKNRE